jgi:hypothetical protein
MQHKAGITSFATAEASGSSVSYPPDVNRAANDCDKCKNESWIPTPPQATCLWAPASSTWGAVSPPSPAQGHRGTTDAPSYLSTFPCHWSLPGASRYLAEPWVSIHPWSCPTTRSSLQPLHCMTPQWPRYTSSTPT